MNLDDERYCKRLHLSPIPPEDYNRKTENCTYKIYFSTLEPLIRNQLFPLASANSKRIPAPGVSVTVIMPKLDINSSGRSFVSITTCSSRAQMAYIRRVRKNWTLAICKTTENKGTLSTPERKSPPNAARLTQAQDTPGGEPSNFY